MRDWSYSASADAKEAAAVGVEGPRALKSEEARIQELRLRGSRPAPSSASSGSRSDPMSLFPSRPLRPATGERAGREWYKPGTGRERDSRVRIKQQDLRVWSRSSGSLASSPLVGSVVAR